MLKSLAARAAATASRGDLVAAHRLLDELDELAARMDDEWLAAESRNARAHVLVEAGRVDEGVAVALEAADTFTMLGDPLRALSITLRVARMLVEARRLEDAVAVYGCLLDECGEVGDLFQVVSTELADSLESLNRPFAASRVRAALGA